ncbi:MAG: hypothetical protein AAGF31_11670 [Planctomycetota bacterium]
MNHASNNSAPVWLKVILGIALTAFFVACIWSGAQDGFRNPEETQARKNYERSLITAIRSKQSLGKTLSRKEEEILQEHGITAKARSDGRMDSEILMWAVCVIVLLTIVFTAWQTKSKMWNRGKCPKCGQTWKYQRYEPENYEHLATGLNVYTCRCGNQIKIP